jgi:NADPH:quinone reductase-like Zn-dependent oxidoreductase
MNNNAVNGKMKAVFINPESGKLYTREVDIPVPGKGEVLIKMLAAPINPSDLSKIREISGKEAEDFIPGIEGCGIVVATGKGILSRLFSGKRVACSSKYSTSGTWAEYMVTAAGSCFPVGKRISPGQAAMALVNPMTALAFLDYAKRNRHQAVVNTAANGALGRMINSIFEKHHIKVLNIVRSEGAAGNIYSGKYSFLLNSRDNDFTTKFKKWCEEMDARLMLDAVGGELVNKVLDCLPANSTILLYGNLSQKQIEFLPTKLVRENKKMIGFFLGHWIAENGMVKTIFNLIKVRKLLAKGMETQIQAVFSLDTVQQAVERYEANMSEGKVLLDTSQKLMTNDL